MKIIAFGVRDDERPFFQQWAQNHSSVSLKLVKERLTSGTVNQAAGYEGVVIVYQQSPFTKDLLQTLHDFDIHALSTRNAGVDDIDLAAVKEFNMQLTNVPAYSPSAIAEFSVTQALNLLRQTKAVRQKIQHGNFNWAPTIGEELNTKTIGVIGTGRIGQAAIKIFQGFGAKVIAYDIYQNPTLANQGLYVKSLTDLYRQADIISLHAPATSDNYHLLNSKAFETMKNGVRIINAARGTLIDTQALLTAVDQGKVGGAALDVYEEEANIFNHDFGSYQAIPDQLVKKLMAHKNILLTPHIAFYTLTAVKNMVQIALDNNSQLLTTGTADHLVTLP
ncbi:D-2-hydroxyacid dehydrogenase [Liquorilactobacillus satsumensis]|uniref:D-2-hydroxyacid dehydrogenase n=1 Tax=Liquorilactobacillus TaxID=2767888 RepID=UPI0021C449BE|nr:D-2-hydroxyacid dehydrogenase [Liquorilactobacillus satsumensis]MCP9313751.1 D-2-hydroxyacid dehydrogenase [Liquorilactobacillus satsumensis]MCP9360892.1 D-2-hydroxyacid dehydrogenase [Liquorilactobacillus satsumensis]